MPFMFTLGSKEKHRISVGYENFMRKNIAVYVDGKQTLKKPQGIVSFKVGEKEVHDIELEITRMIGGMISAGVHQRPATSVRVTAKVDGEKFAEGMF